MEQDRLLYQGKAKKIYQTNEKNIVKVQYLDQVTALNGVRKEQMNGKGELNNQITALIFERLSEKGIPNHFIRLLSKNEQLVESLKIIKLEVVVRNRASGSFSKRLAVKEGTIFPFPVIEFYYKEDVLDDPFLNEDQIKVLKLATDNDIQELKEKALQINRELIKIFSTHRIQLIDFKVEFGRREDGTILLADEITPDTCRLWDSDTNERLDKDLYRKKSGDIMPVYQEVLTRLKQK